MDSRGRRVAVLTVLAATPTAGFSQPPESSAFLQELQELRTGTESQSAGIWVHADDFDLEGQKCSKKKLQVSTHLKATQFTQAAQNCINWCMFQANAKNYDASFCCSHKVTAAGTRGFLGKCRLSPNGNTELKEGKSNQRALIFTYAMPPSPPSPPPPVFPPLSQLEFVVDGYGPTACEDDENIAISDYNDFSHRDCRNAIESDYFRDNFLDMSDATNPSLTRLTGYNPAVPCGCSIKTDPFGKWWAYWLSDCSTWYGGQLYHAGSKNKEYLSICIKGNAA